MLLCWVVCWCFIDWWWLFVLSMIGISIFLMVVLLVGVGFVDLVWLFAIVGWLAYVIGVCLRVCYVFWFILIGLL